MKTTQPKYIDLTGRLPSLTSSLTRTSQFTPTGLHFVKARESDRRQLWLLKQAARKNISHMEEPETDTVITEEWE